MAEGGQSSTGAALQWCRRLFSPTPADQPAEQPAAGKGGAGGNGGGGSEGDGSGDGGAVLQAVSLRQLDDEARQLEPNMGGASAGTEHGWRVSWNRTWVARQLEPIMGGASAGTDHGWRVSWNQASGPQ